MRCAIYIRIRCTEYGRRTLIRVQRIYARPTVNPTAAMVRGLSYWVTAVPRILQIHPVRVSAWLVLHPLRKPDGQIWSYGVVVITLDSESSNRGSNPRRTFFYFFFIFFYSFLFDTNHCCRSVIHNECWYYSVVELIQRAVLSVLCGQVWYI